MFILHDVAYARPNKVLLFSHIALTINKHDKTAIIGRNGTGKSTLIQLLAGHIHPTSGVFKSEGSRWYVPQVFGQFNEQTVVEALGIESKILALREILGGNVSESCFEALADDWSVEERCREALAIWGLGDLDLLQPMGALSGGQKTKVFLAGIALHEPEVVLLDEPTNHLDLNSRQQLYEFIKTTSRTLVVVSHDRTLLNLLNQVYELDKEGLRAYGGNYDFYVEQKAIADVAFDEELKDREKALRKAKEIQRESAERKQKLDSRGRKKQIKAGMPTIALNTLRNNAEKSSSRLQGVHAEKLGNLSQEVSQLRKKRPGTTGMTLGFDDSHLHKGKLLIAANKINYSYAQQLLWSVPVSLQVFNGDRLAIQGANGSGKTTLVRILLGLAAPIQGTIQKSDFSYVYIDQEYSLIDATSTVLAQAQRYNASLLEEHELKSRLTHFLFTKEYWDRPCAALSGGERLRLTLCCLSLGNSAPDIMVLDEPTNNLDIQNMEILTRAVNEYRGCVIVISHDNYFVEQIGVTHSLML